MKGARHHNAKLLFIITFSVYTKKADFSSENPLFVETYKNWPTTHFRKDYKIILLGKNKKVIKTRAIRP